MKILIGIDTANAWTGVANLLVRMFPDGFEAELVSCVESIMPDGSFPELSPTHPLTSIIDDQKDQAKAALEAAANLLANHGSTCNRTVITGNPSRALLLHADQTNCELIAVRSKVKSAGSSLLFGSTAKAVVLGAKQSVLVAKHDHDQVGRVDALISTDHSPFMKTCLETLSGFKSLSLGRLTVFTTNESDLRTSAFLLRDLPDIAELAPVWIKEKLEESNQRIAESLAHTTVETASLIGHQNVKAAIPEAMKSTGSELLIMGAQGHNFFERVFLGSQSMHQLMHEGNSMLLLRPRI